MEPPLMVAPPPPDFFPLPLRRTAPPIHRTYIRNEDPLKPLDIQGGLATYSELLDRSHAAHILRRSGFGADPLETDALIGMTAEDAIDVIVDEAVNQALPDPFDWVDDPVPPRGSSQEVFNAYLQSNSQWLIDFRNDWLMRMYYGGLRERMVLFWHNHFVTEVDTYVLAAYAYRYVETLRTHALGNFKDFVRAIGITPAMLIYLNGSTHFGPGNVAGDANENYARELLELFTMGQFDGQGNENYTQVDIQEIARALTGWVVNSYDLSVQHVNLFFDNTPKTFFGQTDNWDYDDVVDILFEERPFQIAEFICRKLYAEFVYAAPNETFVAELAEVFVANDFEIAPVMRALFKSAHFHDQEAVGAQIKTPVHLMTTLLREVHFENPPNNLFNLLYRAAFFMQQRLLDPPNVAGWNGHHAWVNTTTLPFRWLVTDVLLFQSRNQQPIDLVPVAEILLNTQDIPLEPSDPVSVFTLPTALAETLLPVPLESLDINAPSEGFTGDLINNPIPADTLNGPPHVLDLTKIFLAGVPWYEWNLYRLEAPQLLLAYTRYLTQLPEFQLT
ncbi:MAG: DUF1800 family protein [Rhodothermales bacterium]